MSRLRPVLFIMILLILLRISLTSGDDCTIYCGISLSLSMLLFDDNNNDDVFDDECEDINFLNFDDDNDNDDDDSKIL